MLICVSLFFFEGEGLSMKGTARGVANLEMKLKAVGHGNPN